MIKMTKTLDVDETVWAAHPTGFQILSRLGRKPASAAAIGELMGMDIKAISLYLSKLEERGFVSGKFDLREDMQAYSTAVKYYSLTSKGIFALNRIRAVLEE